MRLSTLLGYGSDARSEAARVRRMELVGVDMVWVPEAYGFDAVTLMGFLAATTERIEIGSGILNIFSRTPALLAQTAAGLDHVSEGRAVLGLGASGPQVVEGWHGIPYDKPLQRTRECIEIIRAALRRDRVTHDGLFTMPVPPEVGTGLGKPLKMMSHPRRANVPIHIAALGPKNVELAAEAADGWIPHMFYPEKTTEVFGDALGRGLAKRQVGLPPLEIVAGGLLEISDDPAAIDVARPGTALYIGGMGARGRNFYFDLACRYGFESDAVKIQELYLSGRVKEAEAAVPVEIMQMTNLIGPASFVRERVHAYAEAGVTVLNTVVVSEQGERALETVRGWLD